MNWRYVATGGSIGSLLRFGWEEVWAMSGDGNGNGFPYATFTANLLGCFLLGWLLTSPFAQLLRERRPELLVALGTGLLGSFTTFSAFSVEAITLFQQEQAISAIVYVILSLTLGIACSALGFALGRLTNRQNRRTNQQ